MAPLWLIHLSQNLKGPKCQIQEEGSREWLPEIPCALGPQGND